MRRLVAWFVALLAVCCASAPALADKRVALVIGNSNYQNVVALTNPANDATAITEMLKKASLMWSSRAAT
jgi:Caspase domain